ncbi:MAG: hypothetical protein FWG70_11270 [Oscillospiraceae bacterium]|nr:hypothetical protein [Oscillospiraceae bacterium]
MSKAIIPFETFTETAGVEHTDFINSLHEHLVNANCKAEIKEAASGYVVSYIHIPTKRTVINYVFRKKGLMLRIYADNVPHYMEILETFPNTMKDLIKKSGSCKRLRSPDDCNARCLMGFDFILDGERQQKCRNGAFMFFLDDETKPYVNILVLREMQLRN